VGGYAYTHQFHVGYSSNNIFEAATQSYIVSLQNDKAVISKDHSSNTKKLNDKIKAVEIEDDDDPVSFKKYSEVNNFCIDFFYVQKPAYVYRYNNSRLPFCEHFSRSSCDKFIINRVIRI
jgi:hypothetical protein